MMRGADPEQRAGAAHALAAFGFWGVVPIYYKALDASLGYYINPLVYDEMFTMAHAASFTCTWAGLAVFSIDGFRQARRLRLRRLASYRV